MPNYACFECGADVQFPDHAIITGLVLCDSCGLTEELAAA